MTTPIVYETTHQVRFADIDPYNHMNTAHYGAYFLEHRMCGLRDNVGWDLKTLGALPFAIWIRRMEVDFIRPVAGDQRIKITSFVREFQGADAHIECTMVDGAGKTCAKCKMIVCCVDKATMRPQDWPPEEQAKFFAPVAAPA